MSILEESFTKKIIWGFPTFKQNPLPSSLSKKSIVTCLVSMFSLSGTSSQLNFGLPIFISTFFLSTTSALKTLSFVFIKIFFCLFSWKIKYATHLAPFPHAVASIPSGL